MNYYYKSISLTLLSFNFLIISGNAVYSQTILLDPAFQDKYVNPLPIPAVIDKKSGGSLTISIVQMNQWLGLKDAPGNKLLTTLFGYNGTYPGPTILAKNLRPLSVNWNNNLQSRLGVPLAHLLPIDSSLHWAFGNTPYTIEKDGIPLVTHLHGGHTEWQSDGYPTAWYTPGYKLKGADFVKQTYYYKNDQEAASLWYHDHTLGLTRANVMAGLAGLYVLTDDNQENLKKTGILPASPYDIPLFLQDRQFLQNGQIFYPSNPDDFYGVPGIDPEANTPNPIPRTSIIPEFFGNFMLVNGMTWPLLEVEPRQYRFRVLNGSDSRMYNMLMMKSADFSMDNVMGPSMAYNPAIKGLPIIQIASDDGFISNPVTMENLFIAPGERKEIIVDFSGLAGQEFILANNANGPFPEGDMVDINSAQLMKIKVSKPINTSFPLTNLSGILRPAITPLVANAPVRKLILSEVRDEFGRLMPSLGTVDQGVKMWMDSVTEIVTLNNTEEWEIYNETGDAHPIHLHSVSMQLVNRQYYSSNEIPMTIAGKYLRTTAKRNILRPSNLTPSMTMMGGMGMLTMGSGTLTNIQMQGDPIIPTADELGWKDTWVIYPGQVMRVRAKFDLPGNYVWHCHILSHEDHDMMRPLLVSKPITLPTVGQDATFVKLLQLKTIPNPFSDICNVQFSLLTKSAVSILLLDVNRKIVKSIFSGTLNTGPQSFSFNGDGLTPGSYICQLTVGNQIASTVVVYEK